MLAHVRAYQLQVSLLLYMVRGTHFTHFAVHPKIRILSTSFSNQRVRQGLANAHSDSGRPALAGVGAVWGLRGGLTRQERVDAQAPVLVGGAAHVHHVGMAGVVGGVGAEVRQHHAAHRQQEAPLVVVSRVRQRRAHVPAVEQEREAQQHP